jgi:hypothetical protein
VNHKKGKKKGVVRKRLNKKTLMFITLIALLVFFIVYVSINTRIRNAGGYKAAIVDHLSASQPNQTFWQTSKSILNMAGFEVYYYASMAVNVEFYRNLQSHGFKLIIFRVHSAIIEGSDFVCLFTSEPYDDNKARTTYLLDVLNDRLVKAMMYEGAPEYFGITPLFVKDAMKGTFDGAVIIMMGCDGLTHTTMADAFVKKGAKVYISWNGPVSASHTDQVTTQLLQHLITEKNTVKDAVRKTNNEAGADPIYKSVLLFYPDTAEAGNYIIDCYTNKDRNTLDSILSTLTTTCPKRKNGNYFFLFRNFTRMADPLGVISKKVLEHRLVWLIE